MGCFNLKMNGWCLPESLISQGGFLLTFLTGLEIGKRLNSSDYRPVLRTTRETPTHLPSCRFNEDGSTAEKESKGGKANLVSFLSSPPNPNPLPFPLSQIPLFFPRNSTGLFFSSSHQETRRRFRSDPVTLHRAKGNPKIAFSLPNAPSLSRQIYGR